MPTDWKMIHYSHSRKDMIGFIKIYEIPLTDYENLSKVELAELLYDKLTTGAINSEIADLLYYLKMSMPRKCPVCHIKKDIFNRIMNLKKYVFYNFKIKKTSYKSIRDINIDLEFISQYGDLPSVRYIVNKVNQDNKIKNKYDVSFSRQPRCYIKDVNKLNVMKGNFLIKFN